MIGGGLMARFDTSGLDETIADMKRLGELSGEVADKMLMVGAEGVKTAWKFAAAFHGVRLTDDMFNSIGFARTPKTIGDVRTIDIYPQGKDRKGVRNAEKAFILQYGTKSKASKQRREKKGKKYPGPGIPATKWVDTADSMSEEQAIPAMIEVWENHLKGK